MSSEAPIGYDVVILSLPSTADFRSRSSVCSLSLIVADETLLSENWASAVDVETCLYPPLPRKKEENTTARTTTRPTQNHTERKIFLRSIHRCRAPGRPAGPSTLLIVRGRRLRPGRAPRRSAERRRIRRYTGAAVRSLDANRKPSDIPLGGHPARRVPPGRGNGSFTRISGSEMGGKLPLPTWSRPRA